MYETNITETEYEHLFNNKREHKQDKYNSIRKITENIDIQMVSLADGSIAGMIKTNGNFKTAKLYSKNEVDKLGQKQIFDKLQS